MAVFCVTLVSLPVIQINICSYTQVSQKSCNILLTCHNSPAPDTFAKVMKVTKLHLVFSGCYSLDLSLRLAALVQNLPE